MRDARRNIVINPDLTVGVLAGVAVALAVIHLALLGVAVATGHDYLFGLVPLFDLDGEGNIPSFFSGLLLLTNGLLFALTSRTSRDPRRGAWVLLSAVFVFLAYDEMFSVHERFTEPIRHTLRTSGPLFYPWFIAYIAPVAVLAWRVLPVWSRLARRPRTRLAVAIIVYLLGAVGMEMLGGWWDEMYGHHRTLGWGLLVTIEETLEMAGLILLVRTLLDLMAGDGDSVHVWFEHGHRRPPPDAR
ncbi:MAG: hypothetical protein R2712_13380 [Vicinamibacterales bacterium]